MKKIVAVLLEFWSQILVVIVMKYFAIVFLQKLCNEVLS